MIVEVFLHLRYLRVEIFLTFMYLNYYIIHFQKFHVKIEILHCFGEECLRP